jgi:ADP-ribose pyrophosphatase
MELGETAVEAVMREVQEETGLNVAVSRFLGYADAIERDEEQRVRYHYVILYFEAEVVGGNLQSGDDAARVRWMTRSECDRELLSDSVRRCLAWVDGGEPQVGIGGMIP